MENDWWPLHISIVERISPRLISISWSSPCMGHYADQVWRVGLARAESRCALSGASIRPGDAIFRPRSHGSRVPINHNRMILASAVARLLQGSTTTKKTKDRCTLVRLRNRSQQAGKCLGRLVDRGTRLQSWWSRHSRRLEFPAPIAPVFDALRLRSAAPATASGADHPTRRVIDRRGFLLILFGILLSQFSLEFGIR